MSMTKRWLQTVCYSIGFIGLGVMEVIGTTLPSLADLLGESSSPGLSFALLARGVGFFVGTVVMGDLLDRFPSQAHRFWVIGTLIFSGSTVLIPLTGSTLGFSAVLFVFASAGGGILLTGNVLVIRLWDGTRYTASGLNLVHVGNSVGSTIFPLIAAFIGLGDSAMVSLYRTLGIITLVTGLLPILFAPPKKICPINYVSTPRSMVRLKFWSLGTLFLFYFFYNGALTDAGDWITTYIVDRSQGTIIDGAYATAAFWGSILLIRILVVPLAMFVNYDILILFEFILAFIGSIIGVTYGTQLYEFTVMAYIFLGLGIAAMYPAGLLLARSRMELTAKWVSVIVSGGVLGAVLLPTITGVLLGDNLNFLPWSELGCVSLMALFYLIVFLMPKVRVMEKENVVLAKSVYNFQSIIPTVHRCESTDYENIKEDPPRINYVHKDNTVNV